MECGSMVHRNIRDRILMIKEMDRGCILGREAVTIRGRLWKI
jgi:hypothetical protein